jgi:hypothetical protein
MILFEETIGYEELGKFLLGLWEVLRELATNGDGFEDSEPSID